MIHPKNTLFSSVASVISVVQILVFLVACTSTDLSLPTLAVLPTQTQPASLLQPWQSSSGLLATASETNLWQINGRAGDQITVKAVSSTEMLFTLSLFTPAGTILAQGETLAAALPADSAYFIQVQANQAGAYDIGFGYADVTPVAAPTIAQVVGVPTPTPQLAAPGVFISQLNPGDISSNRLSADAPLHLYTYMGIQGDVLTLSVQRISGPIDPLISVYDPEGDMIATDDNNGGGRSARLWNVPLPVDGLYTIQISGHEAFGEYTLSLIQGVQVIPTDVVIQPTQVPERILITPTLGVPVGERLVDHAPALGLIDGPSGFARFVCSADVGQTITVAVLPTAGSGLRPYG